MERKELERHLLSDFADNAAPLIIKPKDGFSNSSFWSKLTLRWLNPLFSKGSKQKLDLADIPSLPQQESSDHASFLLKQALETDNPNNPSLVKAILRSVSKPLFLNAILAGVFAVASFVEPLFIADFIHLLAAKNNGNVMSSYGIVLASIFFLAKTMESVAERQWYFGASQIGIRVRASLLTLLYEKLLSIKSDGARNGRMVNFINTDIEKVVELIKQFHQIWLLPFQVILAMFILARNLGWIPTILAVLVAVSIMVSNTPLAKLQKRLQGKIMQAKDSRIKYTSETLKSIKVLKFHAWEPTFLAKLFRLREAERVWLVKFLYTKAVVVFLYWASPIFISVITFGVCAMLQKNLSSGSIFSALATLQILHEPIYNMPELISVIVHANISLNRLQEFLREDRQEQPDSPVKYSEPIFDSAVHITKGEYAWGIESEEFSQPTITIADDLMIMRGKKVAICGSVGSGKSSLICTILREIPKISGAGIQVFGTRAYVPQTPWIQSGTIQDNILFGKKMVEPLYEKVIEACALTEDIDRLIHKDLTIVGERGITLSGGQKQRIQLARAIYSDADVYFLDDPFSAVDAHTKAHLFKHCLMGLLADKTVMYVTHQMEFLASADIVLVMREGRIVQSGAYKDLLDDADAEAELSRLVAAHYESLSQISTSEEHATIESPNLQARHGEEPTNNGQVLLQKNEKMDNGRVGWKAYSAFIMTAYKGALIPVIFICHLLFQGLQMGSNYWISWAVEKGDRVSKKQLIGVFTLISGASSIFVLARALLLTAITVKTSQCLFVSMIKAIFKAPMSFFDTTSSSQILDRSSTDQAIVDSDITYRIAGLVFALIQLITVIILMSTVAWPVCLLFLAIFAISAWYQVYYLHTARELAKMVGIQKAPLLHHFSESISGIVTIRCFSKEARFHSTNLHLINNFSRISFYNCAAMEWICIGINSLFNLGFFVVLLVMVSIPGSTSNPNLAGLAVTYGLNINVLQAWVIWNVCNVESKMISVERILQFSQVPSEASSVIEDHRPRPEWPEIGSIEFQNLQVRYSETFPLVLKGISCTFPGEKRIGIVGRTGSGKSTLIQAIFRLVEPAQGQIIIDGINISKIGLQDLRSKLSIIPQDPTLFQGTVRNNLDPLQQHNDHEIWEVVRKCHLVDMVKQDQRLLDAPVSEEGQNWSLGQRQLICLARILLQKRKILVLDEATASMDTATDNTIQKALRSETEKCTVITVAHRITTILDSDLVLVLDDGNAITCSAPAQLLRDSSSAFSKLVKEFCKTSSN